MTVNFANYKGPSIAATRTNRRVACVTAIVVMLHVALITFLMTKREPLTPVAIESRTITAELLHPEPPAAPVALHSAPASTRPSSVRHVVRERPMVPAVPKPLPAPLPVAAPLVQPAAEARATVAPPQPAPPVPGADSGPAEVRPVMTLNSPKNVSHLDCRIAQPEYPMLSKRRGETGIAYVHFVVDLSGRIDDIELNKSSGYDRLDDAALAAMHDSSCKPYLEDGKPVRAAYTQPFDFSLHD